DRIILMEGSVVETTFRQTPNQWHLPTFESKAKAAAGTCLLPFMPFSTGLAMSGTLPNPESLNPMSGTGSRAHVMLQNNVCLLFLLIVRIHRSYMILLC